MADKIKSYVLTNFISPLTLNSGDLAGYEGMLYQIFNEGEKGGHDYSPGGNVNIHGPSSGFHDAGYIDFHKPYTASQVVVSKDFLQDLQIQVTYTDDPTGGVHPIILKSNVGYTYINTDYVDASDINTTPNQYVRCGFFSGSIWADVGTTQTQRNILYNAAPSSPKYLNGEGNVIPDVYGEKSNLVVYGGGGGYYGSYLLNDGSTGEGFGYTSGNWSTSSNLKNTGYVVISLIPSSILTRSPSLFSGSATFQTVSNENFILYNILGGGGGGGYSNSNGTGAGGGGSGDWITGLLYTSISDSITVSVDGGGNGGSTGAYNYGAPGGPTTITYNTSNAISAIGGNGGGVGALDESQDGNGGPGYYGGGSGGSNKTSGSAGYGGDSYALIPYNLGSRGDRTNDIGGVGAGSVNYNTGALPVYGYASTASSSGPDYNSGGGGGGFWGGNGAVDGTAPYPVDALGPGCGGGGGSFSSHTPGYIPGGNGTAGYALLKYFDNTINTVKFYKVTQPRIFDIVDYTSATGFWYFLGGDSGKSYHNTGHFLLKEDGVRSVRFTQSGGYFSINVYFAFIQDKQQIFTLQATTPENYAMIMFYY